MAKIVILGLGNPGDEYLETRHNIGRIILEDLRQRYDFPDWKEDKKSNALISKGEISGKSVIFVLPETFMNNSGKSVSTFFDKKKPGIKKPYPGDELLVIHDDMDIALGRAKLSFNKNSAGHRGVESIAKVVKSIEFSRIRVGVTPIGPKNSLKKPVGEKAVNDFILGKFKPNEKLIVKKISSNLETVIKEYVKEGRNKATETCNSFSA